MKRKALGIGVNDILEKTYGADGKQEKSYIAWINMLKRCYDESCLQKNPTYRGCSVCDEWLHYSNFKKWFDENYREGYQIDKDVLCRYYGVPSVYSPVTCRRVPRNINNLFIRCNAVRGKYPVGVSFNVGYKRFEVHIRIKRERFLLGYFDDPITAFETYRSAFRAKIKNAAISAYNSGLIDKEYRDAMIAYDITIND